MSLILQVRLPKWYPLSLLLCSFYFVLISFSPPLCLPLRIFLALTQMCSPKSHKHWCYLEVDAVTFVYSASFRSQLCKHPHEYSELISDWKRATEGVKEERESREVVTGKLKGYSGEKVMKSCCKQNGSTGWIIGINRYQWQVWLNRQRVQCLCVSVHHPFALFCLEHCSFLPGKENIEEWQDNNSSKDMIKVCRPRYVMLSS